MGKKSDQRERDLEVEDLRAELDDTRGKLEATREEFDSFRRRKDEECARARHKGVNEATLGLLDVVDDCDRALAAMTGEATDSEKLIAGVTQLRDRVIRHFSKLGYSPFGDTGETFDPNYHEAVSVEAGAGPEGSILRVHIRGWDREGELVRPAMVTVLQGSTEAQQTSATPPRRRRHRPETVDHICPYGVPGCVGDCPGCDPGRHELLGDPDAPSPFETSEL